jgi:hypothetical protein
MLIYGKIQDSEVYYFKSALPAICGVSFKPIGKMLGIYQVLYEWPNSAQSKCQVETGIGSPNIGTVALEVVVVKRESTNRQSSR